MKTKFQLISGLTLMMFGLFILQTLFCQDSYIKHRLNFKLGYTRNSMLMFHESVGNYRLEANYGSFKYLETGVYIGYSNYRYEYEHDVLNGTSSYISGNHTLFYGVNCNFHPLTFLIKKEAFRFDVYLTGKLGGVYFSKPISYYQPVQHYKEFAVGGGLSYYLGKHLGLYMEYCYGKYIFWDKTKFRYGLTLKF
jgi:hypothetical protein